MTPHREPFWGIDHTWIFYALAALAVISLGLGLWERGRRWMTGRRTAGPALGQGLRGVLLDALLLRRLLRGDLAAGLMHLLILWGFAGLFVGTVIVAVDHYLVHFLEGDLYLGFSLAMEVCGLALIGGLLWAVTRRYVQRVPRLERRASDLLLPGWLLLIGLTGFLVEGARLAADQPDWAGWSFGGALVAGVFTASPTAGAAHPALWWVHAILSLGLIAWLPWSRLFHALAAPASLYLQDRPLTELSPTGPDETDEEDAGDDQSHETEPTSSWALRHLVFFDACTRCGRCDEVCPSTRAGEALSPRALVQRSRLEAHLNEGFLDHLPLLAARRRGQRRELAELGWSESWYCTTCRACHEVCPVQVAPLEVIRQRRGRLVEGGSEVPPGMIETLERLYKYGNPWLAKKGSKAGWSKKLDVADLSKKGAADWLYFVGCTTSLDTRAQGLATALVSVLDRCGVSFGTLGKKEPCCGDIARRVGEQGLLEEQRDKTLALLRKRDLARLVCSSPHCWDTFTKLYPSRWDGEGGEPGRAFEALHYTQLLARLLAEGKLDLSGSSLKLRVTYHDPCYLSRHNGVVAEPREVIRAIPGVELVEMAEHGRSSLCCGGGGGRMWQELPGERSLAQQRLAQAAETGAEAVITACPLCLIMLEDGRKTGGYEDRFEVLDLAELVARALGAGE